MTGDAGENAGTPRPGRAATSEKPNRRKRLRLSCDECRKKKLSCDRGLPCQRCVRSGRPELCSFETGTGKTFPVGSHPAEQQAQVNGDHIENLRAEVFRLKELLSKAQSQNQRDLVNQAGDAGYNAETVPAATPGTAPADQCPGTGNRELSDPRQRSPHGYYNQHTLLKFFVEIPQLFPFIKETSSEWLKPLGVHLKKNKLAKDDWKTAVNSDDHDSLEKLLPPKAHTDCLVSFYLDHFEQLHRIVHIPTFKRQYASFWVPSQDHSPAMRALVLSILSISACTFSSSTNSMLMPTTYRAMAIQWIAACDEWLKRQNSKRHKLIQYQISCLLYLAKRMNIVRKKRYWKESGFLVQNAIMDGLYSDTSSTADSPYMREMKRRIWCVIRELDLQNAFEYGLPSLIYNIDSDTTPPTNIDDEEFDEASRTLPTPKPPIQYTFMSYQDHSSRTWALRLQIARHLSTTDPSKRLSYEDVLRYTHDVTEALHTLPPWDTDEVRSEDHKSLPILVYAYLSFQLKECILALHRPYLHKSKSEFWMSGNICYNVARDILLLNTKVAGLGLQNLMFLREDLLVAALSVTHITLQQPLGSTSIITTHSGAMVDILTQCLSFIEERFLRCFFGEPWCVLTMSASLMLLKVHVGEETWQSAKLACAQSFLDLHYKSMGRQQTSMLTKQNTPNASQTLPSLGVPACSTATWPDNSYSDIGTDFFDFDMDFDGKWESWELT